MAGGPSVQVQAACPCIQGCTDVLPDTHLAGHGFPGSPSDSAVDELATSTVACESVCGLVGVVGRLAAGRSCYSNGPEEAA
eukprot:10741863-Karenia_brevis.AAC.1